MYENVFGGVDTWHSAQRHQGAELRNPVGCGYRKSPAEHVGDPGAAAGLVQIAVINDALRAGYAPGSCVVSCCSEASGERTAMILQGTNASSTEAVQLSTARVAL